MDVNSVILMYSIVAIVVAIISATIMRSKLSCWDRFDLYDVSCSMFLGVIKLNMLDNISENNGKLLVKDGSFDNHDYSLVGYVGKNVQESEVTFCQYVPIMLSDEEYIKKFLANRKYALVRSDHPNELYARKKCEVLDEKVENSTKMYLLKVDVSYSTKGFVHWVAFKKKYEEVWFIESDIEKFYEYDENGKLK